MLDIGSLTQELAGIDSRVAHDGAAVGHIVGHARLGTHGDAVADVYVAGKSHLSGCDTVAPDFGRTCHSALGGHDGVGANLAIVGNLHQIVELDTVVDAGLAHCGTVDGSVGPDFHIIPYYYTTYLGYLVIGTLSIGRKAKSIGSHHSPAWMMQRSPTWQLW